MNQTISVIMPVYNVEKYIRKSIESVLQQSYKGLELILVEDGSTDHCGMICDEYAKKDARVTVIHQKNQGLSVARNSGIDVSKGEYLAFVDSDDYIHPNMYEVMLSIFNKEKVDIAICQYESVADNDSVVVTYPKISDPNYKIIATPEDKKKLVYTENYLDSVLAWNKIYKKDLFEGIRYPAGRIYEDEATIFKVLYQAKKIAYIEEKMYYYLRRENSISKSKFSPKRLSRLDAIEDKLNFYIEKKDWELFSEALFVYKTDFLVIMNHLIKGKKNHLNLLKPYKKKYNNYCLKYLGKLPITLKSKSAYMMYWFFPNWYYKRFVKNTK